MTLPVSHLVSAFVTDTHFSTPVRFYSIDSQSCHDCLKKMAIGWNYDGWLGVTRCDVPLAALSAWLIRLSVQRVLFKLLPLTTLMTIVNTMKRWCWYSKPMSSWNAFKIKSKTTHWWNIQEASIQNHYLDDCNSMTAFSELENLLRMKINRQNLIQTLSSIQNISKESQGGRYSYCKKVLGLSWGPFCIICSPIVCLQVQCLPPTVKN